VEIFEGLNPEQRRAAEAVRGPVCILAGAGSGKTTTITRRIANQVATGACRAGEILAVTFTDKAAGEMRARLAALGADGVTARTFHSAALAQLHHFAAAPQRIVSSKALLLRQIGNGLPAPYKFRPAGDLATEVEWAKNRRLTPEAYPESVGEHEPPVPRDLMTRVYREYERRKAEAGAADFEDLLELAIRLLEDDSQALWEVRDRYRAFTVDEYQDVNLLQQTLLDLWLGEREELCAVGDDYQSIYAFTGATPAYLLAMPRRFPHAAVVRLEANYRSTPQVLELANRLVPQLGGAEKTLRTTRAEGPEPLIRAFRGSVDEAAFVVERVRALHAQGVPLEEIAVFFRTNARSADFEEAFHEARIPFQGAALLGRDAARQLLRRLRASGAGPLAETVRRIALEQGWLERPPERLGEREMTRQSDLSRLIRLAEEFDDGTKDAAEWIAELESRFGDRGGERSGVNLLTYHRAKGLEFDAVFLPRLQERELPCKPALGAGPEALAEERRLLYVGLTRARVHLHVSWTAKGKPSRFLAELGLATRPAQRESRGLAEDLPPAFHALRSWRLERAKADDVPAYVVFHNTTLEEIASRRPRSLAELSTVPGVGPTKIERYGDEVLATLADVPAA
jgi:DNA helicase-2/ATP-dependent DNA helicase PcrA